MSRALQMVININWGVTIMDLMMKNTTMAAKIIIFLIIVIIKVVVLNWDFLISPGDPQLARSLGCGGWQCHWHPVAPNGTRWQTAAAVHEGGSTMAPPLLGSE